ncbi:reverse transcriptase domain-containing protein [Tanacetum coccineum]
MNHLQNDIPMKDDMGMTQKSRTLTTLTFQGGRILYSTNRRVSPLVEKQQIADGEFSVVIMSRSVPTQYSRKSQPSAQDRQDQSSHSSQHMDKKPEHPSETIVFHNEDGNPARANIKQALGRFGAPRAIISDRGTHFCNDQFAKVMLKYEVTHRLSTAYHPQTSGQVEVSNRGLKRILERTVGENRGPWLTRLMTSHLGLPYIEQTPSGALRTSMYSGKQSYENSLIYKEKTKRIHDAKIKNRVFNVGDQVLLFNSRLKIFSGKLKSRWSGPFTIVQVFPYGTVELSQNSGPNFKVNGHRLKHYFGGDVPAMDIPDLQTFPKDN